MTEENAIDASIQAMILSHGVPLVALMIFAGEIGVPTGIPIEVALLLVGSHSIHSLTGLLVALVLVTMADILGTMTLFQVARTGGVRLVSRFVRRAKDAEAHGRLDRWRRRLGGHDVVVVFVLRLLPLVRMWAAAGLGLARVDRRDFLLGAAPAALLWAGTPLTLGYVFRGNVQSFEARYTSVSHAILVAAPALILFAIIAVWIRNGGSSRGGLRRARLALGLGVGVGSVAFVIETVWQTPSAVDHGLLALPLPILVVWLVLLGVIALALLWMAYEDLRVERATHHQHTLEARLAIGELVGTIAWLGLLIVVGTIVGLIEWQAPVL